MSLEERLREALQRVDYEPSPDLFARVQRSIEEDRAHRRRLRRVAGAVLAGGALLFAWLGLAARLAGPPLPWWAVEVAVNALLVALLVVLGPLIRRFGAHYAGDVFRAHPPTGRRFLALFDIAYYLIFTGYVLVNVHWAPQARWLYLGLPSQVVEAAQRVAGMLLLMGVLHGLAIALLPMVGLLFSSVWWRARRAELEEAPPPHEAALAADRVATFMAWGALALAVLGAFLLLVPLLLGIGLG